MGDLHEELIKLAGALLGKREGACANDPGIGRRRQDCKCHVCRKVKSCGFCPVCCHWFCRECNPKVFSRGMAAVLELVKGAQPGCCGPDCEVL